MSEGTGNSVFLFFGLGLSVINGRDLLEKPHAHKDAVPLQNAAWVDADISLTSSRFCVNPAQPGKFHMGKPDSVKS